MVSLSIDIIRVVIFTVSLSAILITLRYARIHKRLGVAAITWLALTMVDIAGLVIDIANGISNLRVAVDLGATAIAIIFTIKAVRKWWNDRRKGRALAWLGEKSKAIREAFLREARKAMGGVRPRGLAPVPG
jgi:hypothetical protein